VTFVTIQDRVMARTNLTTTTARTRVKAMINERLRSIATSTNLGRVRFGSVSINTVADTNTITTTGLVKAFTVSIPVENRVLEERTTAQLREYDTDVSQNALPQFYAVKAVNATTLTLQLYPEPDAVYAVVIEGVLTGTDLTADGDVPGLPEDFHDILVFGALADEYPHLKDLESAAYYEGKFEQRKKDLRMWMAKRSFLSRGVEQGTYPSNWWVAGL
jgi:hypothetical protein